MVLSDQPLPARSSDLTQLGQEGWPYIDGLRPEKPPPPWPTGAGRSGTWQRFAPLFRPGWEHPAELDLTPFGAIEDPDDRKFAALAAATQSV
ncbi:MAG TPA: hypothetical protein VML75_23135, partial [Kofleriaceae bacterium]|nr:hypothetical protein [Kofleriaceae bacterium]